MHYVRRTPTNERLLFQLSQASVLAEGAKHLKHAKKTHQKMAEEIAQLKEEIININVKIEYDLLVLSCAHTHYLVLPIRKKNCFGLTLFSYAVSENVRANCQKMELSHC